MNNHAPLRYRAQPYGESWHPKDEASPHQYDYKFSLAESPSAIKQLETWLEEERQTAGSSQGLTLKWLLDNGRFRRFTHQVSNKAGFFVQAGCLITDGFGERSDPRFILTTYRSDTQFFEEGGDRNKPGDSCVFATVLASFESQDPFGHVPTALFNNLQAYCPWALFSRKLLIPDIFMDSRFLGVGYNFEKEDKKYLMLLWHVRTQSTPSVMQIQERQSKQHDVPHWMDLRQVDGMDLKKKPIDALALKWLVNGSDPAPFSNRTWGFLPHMALDATWKKPSIPQQVLRDEIILDLCRIYQQGFHFLGKRIKPEDGDISEREFETHVMEFLRGKSGTDGFVLECIQQPALGANPLFGSGAARLDLHVRIRDKRNETGTPTNFLYLLELKVSEKSDTDLKYIAQCQEYAARQAGSDGQLPDAIILIIGITAAQNVYAIQGAITYASQSIPIHIIKVALNPNSPSKAAPPLEVCHGIIPVRYGNEPVKSLILVRQMDADPTPRLPGGKVERDENPEQGLMRELKEELSIEKRDIAVMRPLFPGDASQRPGLPLCDRSAGQGGERDYRFHPFLVKLRSDGENGLMKRIGMPDAPHGPGLADILEWASDGFGQTTVYPQALLPYLSQELLSEFAICLPAR